jgi:hypothetical protein
VTGTKPSASAGVGFTGDHNTVHNIHNIHNVTINCTPAQKDEIVSFLDTDLDAAVNSSLDPSRFNWRFRTETSPRIAQGDSFRRSTTTGTS